MSQVSVYVRKPVMVGGVQYFAGAFIEAIAYSAELGAAACDDSVILVNKDESPVVYPEPNPAAVVTPSAALPQDEPVAPDATPLADDQPEAAPVDPVVEPVVEPTDPTAEPVVEAQPDEPLP